MRDLLPGSAPGTRRTRRIRFGAGAGMTTDPAKFLAGAVKAEALGYSTFGVADHLMMPYGPLVACQAIAGATTTLRVTQTVLDHDFRHPAFLAKELASLDVFSGGRLQVGLGAGWMRSEYEQVGLSFDPAAVRIERLEEYAVVLAGLFADGPFSFAGRHYTIAGIDGTPKPLQRPRPPIMIGGGGRRLLEVAARRADIVQVMPQMAGEGKPVDAGDLTAERYAEKIDWIRDAAGARFADIELGTQLVHVAITDDPTAAVADWVAAFAPRVGTAPDDFPLSERQILASPLVAIGSLEQVCDKLLSVRDTFGLSYFASPVGATLGLLAPVIERLAQIG